MEKNPNLKAPKEDNLLDILKRLTNQEGYKIIQQLQKGNTVTLQLCDLPEDVKEYEGIPYAIPAVAHSDTFTVDEDGFLIFVSMGGGSHGQHSTSCTQVDTCGHQA